MNEKITIKILMLNMLRDNGTITEKVYHLAVEKLNSIDNKEYSIPA